METSGPITVKGFATIDNVALINVEVRLQTRQQLCLATAHGGLCRSAALGLQSGCHSSSTWPGVLLCHGRSFCCCWV